MTDLGMVLMYKTLSIAIATLLFSLYPRLAKRDLGQAPQAKMGEFLQCILTRK